MPTWVALCQPVVILSALNVSQTHRAMVIPVSKSVLGGRGVDYYDLVFNFTKSRTELVLLRHSADLTKTTAAIDTKVTGVDTKVTGECTASVVGRLCLRTVARSLL